MANSLQLPMKDEVEPPAEGQAVTAQPPEDGHHAGDAEALRHHRQHVLLANQTAVEQRQTGQGHEQHQRGRGHLPGVVAGAGAGNLGGRVRAGVARAVVDVGFEVFEPFLRPMRSAAGAACAAAPRERVRRREAATKARVKK